MRFQYKHDRKLFRRYTCNAEETRFTELQFADDAALLTTKRTGAEDALHSFIEIAAAFGLLVSMMKTKLMVTRREFTADDRNPISVGDNQVENVAEFAYLGSVISSSGRMKTDIDQRIAQTSRAFGRPNN